MYNRIEIKNFRGLAALQVQDLRRINLIVGKNNTGKTSLLEAVLLLGGTTHAGITFHLGTARGQLLGEGRPDPDPIWRPLFYRLNPTERIEIAGDRGGRWREQRLVITASGGASYDGEDGVVRAGGDDKLGGLSLRYENAAGEPFVLDARVDPFDGAVRTPARRPDIMVPSSFLSARSYANFARDTERYSRLVRSKQEQPLIEAMRLIEPGLQRLEVVAERAGPTVYADVGLHALVPLAVCGEGLVRLFSIMVALSAQREGVLLVDEIDNGLHHGVMLPFWRAILKLATELDVQVFATTHNDDIIRSAIDAFADDLSVLRLYRLDRRDGHVVAVRYDELALEGVREHGVEVRG
ncbi:AAA family ATPase [Sorangium sp. So ce1024]|uniref:AAA family ATPase n=1 Tax=unclassified Sorangium TaxID=2621164 RepID=UPI003EFD067C